MQNEADQVVKGSNIIKTVALVFLSSSTLKLINILVGSASLNNVLFYLSPILFYIGIVLLVIMLLKLGEKSTHAKSNLNRVIIFLLIYLLLSIVYGIFRFVFSLEGVFPNETLIVIMLIIHPLFRGITFTAIFFGLKKATMKLFNPFIILFGWSYLPFLMSYVIPSFPGNYEILEYGNLVESILLLLAAILLLYQSFKIKREHFNNQQQEAILANLKKSE